MKTNRDIQENVSSAASETHLKRESAVSRTPLIYAWRILKNLGVSETPMKHVSAVSETPLKCISGVSDTFERCFAVSETLLRPSNPYNIRANF